MVKIIARVLFFTFGLAVIFDALLPNRVEHVEIDGHDHYTTRDRTRSSFDENHYRLNFSRGAIGHCDVGYSAYSALKDGDPVDVKATRLFNRCTDVRYEGRSVFGSRVPTFAIAAGGIALVLAALGVFGLDKRMSIQL